MFVISRDDALNDALAQRQATVEDDTEVTGGPAPGDAADDGPTGLEALACRNCRARKLKCDRVSPACTRCTRLAAACVYPESRRKTTVKRRNVKDLEERLAQVESLLRQTAEAKSDHDETPTRLPPRDDDEVLDLNSDTARRKYPAQSYGPVYETSGQYKLGSLPFRRYAGAGARQVVDGEPNVNTDLIGMGMFETLPPAEIIDELHTAYFTRQHPLLPIIHPGRYLQAYHSHSHLRPPMALCYAIWTNACNSHEKYARYHDAFHRRARAYLQEDELRDEGEHFVSLAHAQAWILIATDEARCMWFTKACMSTARAVKLVSILGLHRLDEGPNAGESMPTLLPPKDCTELEERRRVYWGTFCLDSHGSFSTGWPLLLDALDATTHLPSSEDAFMNCRQESTCTLKEALDGASYTSFATAIITCHMFNQVLNQVHRNKPNDRQNDVEHGLFWQRHRELDTMLSQAFMFLPERCRLPNNLLDPVAVHTNLNLHSAIICLHNKAAEVAEDLNLPQQTKDHSKTRLLTSSQQIVDILKVSKDVTPGYRSPMSALAFYVACSTYVSILQSQGPVALYISNLEYLLEAMADIGREHQITISFLKHCVMDVQEADLTAHVRLPKVMADLASDASLATSGCGNIPLFARSRASKHASILPPLPGRLPLGKPIGRPNYCQAPDTTQSKPARARGISGGEPSSKRKRTAPPVANLDTPIQRGPMGRVEDWVEPESSPATNINAADMDAFKRRYGKSKDGFSAAAAGVSMDVSNDVDVCATLCGLTQAQQSSGSASNASSPRSGHDKSTTNSQISSSSSAATPPACVGQHQHAVDSNSSNVSSSYAMETLPMGVVSDALMDDFATYGLSSAQLTTDVIGVDTLEAPGFYAQVADAIEDNYLDLGMDNESWRLFSGMNGGLPSYSTSWEHNNGWQN